MNISDKAKSKMANQRLKRIKEYYNFYSTGDSLYNRKGETIIVLVKHKFQDECYFVVQNILAELILYKLVYNGSVSVVSISKNGVKYCENKRIFDSWFSEAQAKLNRWLRSYYKCTRIGKVINESYTIVLKKEFKNNYYFVLRHETGKYLVAKLIWYKDVQAILISPKEFAENKTVFSNWINEAKASSI